MSPDPRRIDPAGAAGDVVFELVDIAGDAPSRLLSAKLVGKVDVDWALHGWKDEAAGVAFQPARAFRWHDAPSRSPCSLCCGCSPRRPPRSSARLPMRRRSTPPPTMSPPGQDEPGYRAWYAAAAWRPVYVRAFHNYLVTYGVGGVAPTWQLLRTATDWQQMRRRPVRSPADQRMAQHRRHAALTSATDIVPGDRAGRAGVGLSQPALNACAGGARDQHPSRNGRGRHRPAAPDHAARR